MTREEFAGPWALLLAQPWGKTYRPETDTIRAQLQFELYWKHTHRAHPAIWEAVCETYAGGTKWPALDDLKQTILNNTSTRRVPRLEGPAPDEMPVPLTLLIQYHRLNQPCTIADAALAVFPAWGHDSPADDQTACVKEFLRQAQKKFGSQEADEGPSLYGMPR